MFSVYSVVIEAFVDEIIDHYTNMYGYDEVDIHLLISNARNSLETIANSDAPYHDVNHTIMVTMVGQEILRGKHLIEGGITSQNWVHFVLALLNHDIGYVRGICCEDRDGHYVINQQMDKITPPPGATDAYLTPYHVDRGKIYIAERFDQDNYIDVDEIARAIERTRFPVPEEHDHQEIADDPGLIRAADLIGQLADPQYLQKIASLFAEFQETGQAEQLGYKTSADVRKGYSQFFWEHVDPYITEGIRFLRRTQEGQQWVANLYANLYAEENETPSYGPERRRTPDRRIDEPKSKIKMDKLNNANKREALRRRSETSNLASVSTRPNKG